MKPKGNYKHGSAKKGAVTRTYKKWLRMRDRCTNPNSENYPQYGGRGIAVCPRWNSFEKFLEDMGEAPPGLSLERKNNDKNYEPGNCRWASATEQCRNRSVTILLTKDGKTQTLIEWASELGLTYKCLWGRLRRGLSHEKALNPLKSGKGGPRFKTPCN